MEVTVRRIMTGRYSEQVVTNVIEQLVKGKYTHDQPMTSEDANAMGLKISTSTPTEVYQLMQL